MLYHITYMVRDVLELGFYILISLILNKQVIHRHRKIDTYFT